jgi:hypothetical protein
VSYDSKCYELAEYFFGSKDPRLQEIAQEIQDAVESFPAEHDGETAAQHLSDPISQPYRGPLDSNPLIPSWCKE